MLPRTNLSTRDRPSRPTTADGGLIWRPAYLAVVVFVLAAALAAGLIWRQEQYRVREARISTASGQPQEGGDQRLFAGRTG